MVVLGLNIGGEGGQSRQSFSRSDGSNNRAQGSSELLLLCGGLATLEQLPLCLYPWLPQPH